MVTRDGGWAEEIGRRWTKGTHFHLKDKLTLLYSTP